MQTPAPGNLTAIDTAVLDGGAVAEVVIDEFTSCRARLHTDGAWSGWMLVAEGVRDASVTAYPGHDEPSALLAVVVLVPLPPGVHAVSHTLHQDRFFRLTAGGITSADL
jgi:hypothetical protein